MAIIGDICGWYNPKTKTRCRAAWSDVSLCNSKSCMSQVEGAGGWYFSWDPAPSTHFNTDSDFISFAKEIFPDARNFGYKHNSWFIFDTNIGSFRYDSWADKSKSELRIQLEADYEQYKEEGVPGNESLTWSRTKPTNQSLGLHGPFCNYGRCRGKPVGGHSRFGRDPNKCSFHQPRSET